MTDFLLDGEDPAVVLDRHPVTVTLGTGEQLRGRRAVATRTHLYVFRRDGKAVALDFVREFNPDTAVHVGPNVPRFRTSRLDLVDGGNVVTEALIAPEEGCGCGSPLVGFVPWSPYTRAPLRTS